MAALAARRPSTRVADERERRPHLRVVGPPRHTLRWGVLLTSVVAAGVFGSVSLSALAAEQAFEVRTLESEITELTHRYEELTAEVATLEAPARVRRVAEQELGMVPAEQPAYLMVDDGPPMVPVAHVDDGPGRTGLEPLADPLKPALGAGR